MNVNGSDLDETKQKRRDELLLKMYDQLWNSINSHFQGIWQSFGVVIGAFALLTFVEKQIIPIDWAVTLIIIFCAWLIANVLDSSYWYNRNLVIIANIEKDFLSKEDGEKISNYFLSHREKNKKITHFKIQFYLGITISVLFLVYHFVVRVYPIFSSVKVDFQSLLPYLSFLIGGIILYNFSKGRNASYEKFVHESHGRDLINEK